MRKQTKLVAVTSAAALLAIGASMTSFAATGWTEEAGRWYYYDSDGYAVEDEWKKSGDKWFWLSSEEGGAMATESLIEDDEYFYYVDTTGAMVTNSWIKVVNEDQDDDNPAEYIYYYMGSNGRAYKGNGNNVSTKTIDGKRYAFDEDSQMLYGWVDDSGSRITDEEGWADEQEDIRYFGEWTDGAMKTGWQKIAVVDDSEDEEYWFYFNSNGTRFYNETTDGDEENFDTKKINGRTYGFDNRGVMVYEWNVATDGSNDDPIPANQWSYFNSPEDGARVTKGWFQVIPPTEDTTFTADITDENSFDEDGASDEDLNWYYANGDGTLLMNGIESIKGKYYAFNKNGKMLTGLMLVEDVNSRGEFTKDNVNNDEIDENYDSPKYSEIETLDHDELEDLMDNQEDFAEDHGFESLDEAKMYYFGDSSDGSMKTGIVTVDLDGNNHQFKFATSGGVESKGQGVQGVEDEQYIYNFGKRIKADSDDKYILVDVYEEEDKVVQVDESEIRSAAVPHYEMKEDGDGWEKDRTVDIITATWSNAGGNLSDEALADQEGEDWIKSSSGGTIDFDGTEWSISTGSLAVDGNVKRYLVNTSGVITKNKSAARDGAEWYYFVENYQVRMYANDNDIKDLSVKEDASDVKSTEDGLFDNWN